jgi:hypothetical protein
MSPVTKMVIGFTVGKIPVCFILIEIIGNMVSGVCRHSTPTGTELPHTPGFYDCFPLRVSLSFPVL